MSKNLLSSSSSTPKIACQTACLVLNADLFRDYVQYVADRRLERIGLPVQYNSPNPFPWMSETMDLAKEKNFFETRVTEYQTGGKLDWD